MKLFTDSSALAKRYIFEQGSEQINAILQDASELAISMIIIPEIISALNRSVRQEIITNRQYQQLKNQFMADIRDAIILQVTNNVISRSITLLENHSLRTLDSLHIASAAEWNADLFVTSDKKQWLAAKDSGLAAKFIGKINDSPPDFK